MCYTYIMATRGKQPTPVDLAYIAGFIDGEGTIGIYGKYMQRPDWNPQYAERILVVQISQEPLNFIKQFFPKGSLSAKKVYDPTHKQTYVLKYTHTQAYALAKAILPYLQVKRLQAEALVEYRENIVLVDRTQYSRTKRLLPEEAERRNKIYLRLRDLNRVGVQPQRLNQETPQKVK